MPELEQTEVERRLKEVVVLLRDNPPGQGIALTAVQVDALIWGLVHLSSLAAKAVQYVNLSARLVAANFPKPEEPS